MQNPLINQGAREKDPVFQASSAAKITKNDINNLRVLPVVLEGMRKRIDGVLPHIESLRLSPYDLKNIRAIPDIISHIARISKMSPANGYTPKKGVDYFDGKDGKDGVNGFTPIKGIDFFDGKDGKDGYTPIKGKDYFDGKDGKDGRDGKDGVSKEGKPGRDGVDGRTPVKGVDYFDGKNTDPSVIVNIASGIAQNVIKEHLEKFDHSLLHDPFTIGTQTIDEKDIGDGRFLRYDAKRKKIVYGTPAKETWQKILYRDGGGSAGYSSITGGGGVTVTPDSSHAGIITLSLDSTYSPTFVGLTLSGLTASRAVVTDGSKNLSSSPVTATELSYLSGVTSAIQTQLDTLAGGAPNSATYVTLSTNGILTSERVLTGTSNQITVTDNGAGSTVVLSLPQNIHTAATPTFAGATISGLTAGSIPFAGTGGLISQDNANLFWDDLNNRLGIGTASPDRRLHIVGNTNFPVKVLGSAGGGFIIGAYDGNWGGFWSSEVTPSLQNYAFLASAGGVVMNAPSGAGLQFAVNDSVALSITSTKLVGINDTTPDAQLDVVASSATTIGQIIQGAASQSANLQEWQNSAGTVLAKVTAAGNIGVADGNGLVALTSDGADTDNIGIGGGGAIDQIRGAFFDLAGNEHSGRPGCVEIYAGNVTGGEVRIFTQGTQRLTVDYGGNVGIGTTAPAAKLDVNGDIFPTTDNTYYLGKNDDDTPKSWKGVILKDTTNGKYYRIEVVSGVITATDLTD